MQYVSIRQFIIVSGFLYCFFAFQNDACAINLNFRRTFSFRELYSDNINLAQSGLEKDALVTEFSPGFYVNGRSARYRFNLNYSLQSVYNAGGDSGLTLNNRLQYNSTSTFIRNRLFLDARSSISQQNINNTQIVTDNLTGNNSSTITTFSLSPYWTPHFGQFANGVLRVTYDRVGSGTDQLSDTNSFSENISLRSGRYFSTFRWAANFSNITNQNSSGEDISFQNSSVQFRYLLNKKLSLTSEIGQSNNDFQTTTNTNQNGFFYTFGGQWRPSRKLSVAAGWGNNNFVTVFLSPFQRLQWTTTYRNNDIGTNTGTTWQTNFRYLTPRSVWRLTYNVDTTTTQLLLLERQFFLLQDNQGNIILDSDTGLPLIFFIDLPTLTDEVFTRKRGDLSYSFRSGKSLFNAGVYTEKRTFQISLNKDDIYGIQGAWSWRLGSRLNTFLTLNWQNTDTVSTTGPVNSRLFNASFRVQRNFFRNLSGNIEYRYLNQSSDNDSLNYQENRVSIGLTGRF